MTQIGFKNPNACDECEQDTFIDGIGRANSELHEHEYGLITPNGYTKRGEEDVVYGRMYCPHCGPESITEIVLEDRRSKPAGWIDKTEIEMPSPWDVVEAVDVKPKKKSKRK